MLLEQPEGWDWLAQNTDKHLWGVCGKIWECNIADLLCFVWKKKSCVVFQYLLVFVNVIIIIMIISSSSVVVVAVVVIQFSGCGQLSSVCWQAVVQADQTTALRDHWFILLLHSWWDMARICGSPGLKPNISDWITYYTTQESKHCYWSSIPGNVMKGS